MLILLRACVSHIINIPLLANHKWFCSIIVGYFTIHNINMKCQIIQIALDNIVKPHSLGLKVGFKAKKGYSYFNVGVVYIHQTHIPITRF